MITLESIIKKLGFDPRTFSAVEYYGLNDPNNDSWACDDSKVSPFRKLSIEEKEFLLDMGLFQ